MRPKHAVANIAVLLIFVLAACTVGPDFVRPKAPAIKQYVSGGEPVATATGDGLAQHFDTGFDVPARWWKLFNSSKLDPIIMGALDGSPSLQAALANLRQSEYSLEAGYGAFYPQLNANGQFTREKSNPSSFGVDVPSSRFNLLTLSSSVSYALDVFGGQRRTVEGLSAQVDYERYAVLAAYLTLTGNVVNTLIARAAYEAEIEATKDVIGWQKQELAITNAQVHSGTTALSALLAIQSQLSSTRATLPPLRERLVQSEDLLASLEGKTPQEWTAPAITMSDLSLPENLPKSLPSDLVRQRPDILEAEAELHVASAQVGVATAALYPSFTLNGEFGVENTSAGNLLSANSDFWNFGAGILAPLFHGGSLRAQKKAALEAFQSSLGFYRGTVVNGISQVADTLHALRNDADWVQAQSEGVNTAKRSLELLLANYRAGTANYLQILTADAQYSQSRIGYLSATAQRLQDTVALFLALGGGWWKSDKALQKTFSAPKETKD